MSLIRPSRSLRRGLRRGFTLVELLIVIVLLAIVGGTLMRILAGQQRFFRSAGDLLELRSQLRQASGAIAADLRDISSKGGDILAVTDSSIDFRQTFGNSVICQINSTQEIVIPPTTLSSGLLLTNWLQQPTNVDRVMVLDEGPTDQATDDSWDRSNIQNFTPELNICPMTSGGFTSVSDATSNSYIVDLASPLGASVKVGAPVRFYHHAHYSLYQSTDQSWYLGYCTPDCGSGIQAVAGPFLPYTNTGTGGLTFTYYDSTGTVTTTPSNIARIRIALRGQTRGQVNIAGMQRKTVTDSVVLNVAIRNR